MKNCFYVQLICILLFSFEPKQYHICWIKFICLPNCFDRYDMWSVGVVILELIVGSPNVFEISGYTRVLLDQHLEGWNEGLKELAYK